MGDRETIKDLEIEIDELKSKLEHIYACLNSSITYDVSVQEQIEENIDSWFNELGRFK